MTLDIIECLLLLIVVVVGVGLIASLPLYFKDKEAFGNSIDYILKDSWDPLVFKEDDTT